MTKVGRLYADEKEKAVEEAVGKAIDETVRTFVINLLKDGTDESKIIQLCPQVSLNDVRQIAESLEAYK